MVINWRMTYGSTSSEIKCTDIVEKLKKMQTSDDMFKLNFIVLFFSTMEQSTKNQTCDQRILNVIEKPDDVRELNWCDYILHNLRTSKQIWDKDRSGQFTGPITFLMALYMDVVEDWLFIITRQIPVIKTLTDEIVAKRIQSENRQGGFGHGTILPRNEQAGSLLFYDAPVEDIVSINSRKNYITSFHRQIY
ncbi:hypothetical protein QQ045_011631 [Rhodiola kirilowii]